MSLKYAIALAAFFALASASRADKIDMQVHMSKTDFDAARSRMIEQLDSARYAEITPKDKAAVIGALDRIGQRLAKSSRDDQDLVDIFNDQELINQITTHAKAESRLYCKRDKITGSHVMKVTCMSMANWTQVEKDAQTAMRDIADNHRTRCPGCMIDGFNPDGL
jgi:TRAP-type C4-dicarboxylate transport system substrate-binding protein